MKITTKLRISTTMVILLLSGLHVMSQNLTNAVMPQIPPSPQAVAFNRLGEYQVNNNYGAPDINIPLWEIDFHGYKIPLSLHYEANPLKPGYCYDVTGIGWTLSGNSCVSRTIKDRADELPGPFEIASFTLDSFTDKRGNPRKYKNEKDRLHELNFQYDTYNIVLPSGRSIPFFMYVQKGSNGNKPKFDLLSHDQNVIIECKISNINKRNASIDSFIVKDENGITYHFTVADKTTNSYTNDLNTDRNVTWLLTRIYLPNKGSITYNYSQNKVKINAQNLVPEPVTRVHRVTYQNSKIYEALSHEDFAGLYNPEKFRVTQTTQNQCPAYEMRFLESISYDSTVVNFNYADDKKHMKEIVVSDYNTSTKKYDIIRKFSLSVNGRECPGFFLNSIVISGQNDTDKLVYGFEYYNNLNLGNYTDYWGNRCRSNNAQDIGNFNMFVNIKEDGSYLSRDDFHKKLDGWKFAQLCDEKETDPYYYYKIKLQSTLEGDSRKPAQPNEHGILTKIIYPNGGYTKFDWENHHFLTATAEDGDFVYDRRKQRIIEGGGFRIKSVINFTADDEIASQDHYRYGYTYGEIKQTNFPLPLPKQYDANKHIGCGEAVVDPNILTFMDYSLYDCEGFDILKMAVGLDSKLKNAVNPQGGPIWWDADFSANTFRALLGGRRPVVYPEITVYHGDPEKKEACKSKTVYKYDIYNYAMNKMNYYLTYIFQFGKDHVQLDTAYFEPIRYYIDYIGSKPLPTCDEIPYKRHLLKSVSNYSYNCKTWKLVSEEENKYEDYANHITKSGYRFNSSISREWESFFDNSMYINDKRNSRSDECYINYFYEQTWQKLGVPVRLTKKTTTVYRQGGNSNGNTMTEEYSYLYSGVVKSQESASPNDNTISVRYSYVGEEDDSYPVLKEMKKRNILASTTSAETNSCIALHHKIKTGSKTDYAFYTTKAGATNILPSKLYESNGTNKNGEINYEPSIEVKSYDDIGNPTEIVDLKTGVHSVFLWDAQGRYMTAMIKNATLSEVGTVPSGTSLLRYKSLKSKLPNSLIETWDYKPLIGVSAHTDVSGQTFVYEYDGLGRLKSEKRKVVINNNTTYETIHEYEYNYKNGME